MENTNEIIVLSQELKKQVNYSITEERLKEIEQEALALKVAAVDDLKGYGLCKAKRNEIVKIRTGLDRERVKIKEEAQAFVKYVDSSARLIRTRLEDLETTLKQQELIVENEIARKKAEHERMLAERRASRIETLRSFRFEVKFEDLETLANMSDEDFSELSRNAESQFKEELAREQAERQRQEAERKRLAELELENKRREEELRLANEKIAEMQRKANEEARKRAEELAEQERKKAQEQEALRLIEQEKARAELAEQKRIAAKCIEAEYLAQKEKEEAQRKFQEQQAENERLKQAEEDRILKEKLAKEHEARVWAELCKVAQAEQIQPQLLENARRSFPTLHSAHVEIARLVEELANSVENIEE
jgi:hypothetical protein